AKHSNISGFDPVATESERMCDYVADMQVHMALQARNLVPSMDAAISDGRQSMLQQAQAASEKFASRSWLR
ncbi:MAG: hypothetical protein AAF978_03875, partial [Cyanobacteria bacterium P01_E01_bin.48]